MRDAHCLRCGLQLTVYLFPLVIVSGCATYSRVGERYTEPRSKLVVTLPAEWLHYTAAHDEFLMTRDGLRLERIGIRVRRLGTKLPGTERVYQPGMLPLEVAELTLGLMTNVESAKNFTTDKIELAQVAGCEGFRADATFVDEQGLHLRMRLYGVVMPEAVAELRFVGEASVNYDKYLPVFERMMASAAIAAHK
jgi:hypothetical protein